MITALNQKIILPVTKAADYLGFSIVSLWKKYVRDTGSKYSYPTFHGVTSGRIRIADMEAWLIHQGFGKELRKAQEIQNKKKK